MRGRCRFLVGGKRGDRASNRARLCVSSSLGEMEAKGEGFLRLCWFELEKKTLEEGF